MRRLSGADLRHARPRCKPGAVAIGAVVLWGMAGWGFGPAQATRLIRLAPDVSPITLSLHASAVYVGIALGSSVGALALAHGGPYLISVEVPRDSEVSPWAFIHPPKP